MIRSLVILALAVSSGSNAIAQMFDVAPDLWDRPRTGGAVLAQESVKRAVLATLAQPGSQLVIHHSAAQELLVQAEELRAWLGALAIDTRRIVLRGDLGAGVPIKLEIIP